MSMWSPSQYCPLCREPFYRVDLPYRGLVTNQKTRDHFFPVSFIHRYHSENQQGANIWHLCARCNNKKGNRLPTAFETVQFSIRKGYCNA